jgi:predicted RNA binding protein YcfA (HicA-like mRNA interferase family)
MKLPIISGNDLVKALIRLNFSVDHQTGSHIIMRLNDLPYTRITIPNHKVIAKGTLRAIMRQTDLSLEKLIELLK